MIYNLIRVFFLLLFVVTIASGCQSDKLQTIATFHSSELSGTSDKVSQSGAILEGDESSLNQVVNQTNGSHNRPKVATEAQVIFKEKGGRTSQRKVTRTSNDFPNETGYPKSHALQDGANDRININEASETELVKLPGVGPATARKIIAYRSKRPFRRTREIMRIRGIGPARYAAIRDRISV